MPEKVESIDRRLCVIFAADVAGYSRLMGCDEEGTLRQLVAARRIMDERVRAHGGRIVNSVGDSVLAEFTRTLDATHAALSIQRQIAESGRDVPADRRVMFRIGLQLGEVMVRGTDIYGDGINVAARLQTLAEPGGIVVSRTLYEQLGSRLSMPFVDIGDQTVKNIDRPVPAYALGSEDITKLDGSVVAPARSSSHRPWTRPLLAAAMLAGIGLAAIPVWIALHPSTQTATGRQPLPLSVIVGPLGAPADDPPIVGFADALRRDLANGIPAARDDVAVLALPPDGEAKPGSAALEVVRRIGVRYLLEGHVQRSAGAMLVNLRLIDANSGVQVWSHQDSFRNLDDGPQVSFEKRRWVARLTNAVKEAETKRVLSMAQDQLSPSELALRARAVINQAPTLNSAKRARRLLAAALAADPNNVMALKYSGFLVSDFLDLDPAADVLQLGQEANAFAARAMQLDSSNPLVWDLRARSLIYLRHWNAALEANDQAIRLDPHRGDLRSSKAYTLILAGRPGEALKWLDSVVPLNPLEASAEQLVRCYALLLLGENRRAIESCERSNGADDYWGTQVFLVALHALEGDMTRAAVAVKALERGAPGYTLARARRYSDAPEYVRLAEATWIAGLRKAGVPEQ